MKTHYKIIPITDTNTNAHMCYWLIFIINKNWIGITEGEKPVEFASRKEAKAYAEKMIEDGKVKLLEQSYS